MGAKSKIEWTDASWNPVTGCSPVSPACDNCYAEKMAHRLQAMGAAGYERGFEVTLHPNRLEEPLHWKKPRRIFVVSMGDLFHDDVPNAFLDQVFAVMALCPQHTFQVLTKRAERMCEYITGLSESFKIIEAAARKHGYTLQWETMPLIPWPLPNVEVGVTAENQEQADKRIPSLLKTPVATRFVSVEPMLGPVELQGFESGHDWLEPFKEYDASQNRTPRIDGVICGCESGPLAHRRYIDINHIRNLRNQCVSARVPFFLKQMPSDLKFNGCLPYHDVIKMPELDGRVWNQLPGDAV